MLFGQLIKKFELFTFYKVANSIDFNALTDSPMLIDIGTYHQMLLNLWNIQVSTMHIDTEEVEALNAGDKMTIFDTKDFQTRAVMVQQRGKDLIDYYEKLVPDVFIKPEKEDGPFNDLEPVE